MKTNHPSTIIAIDPDVHLSGVAILDSDRKTLELSTASITDLALDLLPTYRGRTDVQVIVEAGWLNAKSSWHAANGRGGERIAKNVGANHQRGRDIAEFASAYGLNVVRQIPLRKSWRGKDGKITHEEIEALYRFVGIDFPKRTNQDARDAALLALNASGLPMLLKL